MQKTVSLRLAPPRPLTGRFQHRLKQQNTISICKKKRQNHSSKVILMMLGMQILRVRGKPPPPPRDLDETQVFSTQAPKTLENYRVLDTQHTMPKKQAAPKAFGFDKRSEGRPSCGLPSTRSTGVGGFSHMPRAAMQSLVAWDFLLSSL